MRITRGNQLARRHDDQRIGTLNRRHRVEHRHLDTSALETLLYDRVRQHLGVRRGVEDAAGQLDALAQRAGIDQIAVVRQRQIAFAVRDAQRLCILAALQTGRRVADMADRHISGHIVQNALIEHIVDQTEILMGADHTVIVDRDAAGLLTAVLQGKQCRICLMRRAQALCVVRMDINAEYAAFFVDLVRSKRRTGGFSHSILHCFSFFAGVVLLGIILRTVRGSWHPLPRPLPACPP